MDPTNNPTPTPNPNSAPGSAPGPMPGSSSGSMASSASGVPPVQATPAAPGMMSAAGQPVNPVVQPSGAPVQPPVNPIVRPSGMGVTDPIMMPEKPREPDPVEEELKAPMKAAAPVPGSIGSAVSGPSAGGEGAETPAENPFANKATNPTPSVAFTDPAANAEANNGAPQQVDTAKPAKKKTNKTTLIALIAVAAVVVVVLVIVLVMQLMGGGSTASNELDEEIAVVDTGGETVDEGEEAVVDEDEGDVVAAFVVCTSEQEAGNGLFNVQKITITTENNKVLNVGKETSVVDADGFAESKESEETSIATIVGSEDALNTAEEQFISENGDVLVSLDMLSERLQTVLNESGGPVFACMTA